MAQMKDSGVAWIGEIPEAWLVCRIKNIASLYGRIGFRGYTSEDLNKDGNGAMTLSPSNMEPMRMKYDSVTYLSWNKYYESPEIMIQNGDLLMVKTGSSYGKVSYVDNLPKEATINPQILRIIPHINSKYLGYYMQTSSYLYQVEGAIVGGTIPTIAQEKINNFIGLLPPLSEQQSIASFLDKKCGEIDSLIALQEEMIGELQAYKQSVITGAVTKGLDPNAKMKDSGVEWIGEIPEHWEVMRFKDFTSLQTTASDSPNKIGLENIEGGTGRFIDSNSKFEGNGIAFYIGDIVYGKLRPYLQKVWVATFSGNAVGDFFVFRPKDNCYSKYLLYSMLSDGFTSICKGSTIGAKMPRVSSDFIRSLHCYIPPLSEQRAIVTYLDTKTAQIDSLISIKQEKIAELKDYKKSIIYEYVTGKKRV